MAYQPFNSFNQVFGFSHNVRNIPQTSPKDLSRIHQVSVCCNFCHKNVAFSPGRSRPYMYGSIALIPKVFFIWLFQKLYYQLIIIIIKHVEQFYFCFNPFLQYASFNSFDRIKSSFQIWIFKGLRLKPLNIHNLSLKCFIWIYFFIPC